jgi:AraC-like DNA-binding protein
MDSIKRADGFVSKYFFVLPDDFLLSIKSNKLFNFLMITDIGYFPYARYHFCQRPKGCETAIFIYCCAGEGYYSINDGSKCKVVSGQVIVIPPNTPHEYGADNESPWSIYWVHLKGSFFPPYYKMVSSYIPVMISEIIGEKLRDIFHQCFSFLKRSYNNEEYFYLCQLIGTILALVSCAGKESELQLTVDGKQGLEKAITFMREHLHEMISLKQIVEVTQFSSSHLNYLFKRSTGYAPIEYFLRIKIQASSKDLYFSNIPIKDIALFYGIEDPYYFSRQFKKIMGLSPKNFRNRISG